MSFISELSRRKVIKVGGAYLVAAWLAVQAASIGFPAFDAPPWALRVFILVVLLGFPMALVFAWAFDITPQGVKAETGARGGRVVALIAAALAALALVWYFKGQPSYRTASQAQAQASSAAASVAANPAPDKSANEAAPLNPKSIAVLPFTDLSPDHDQEYFSDGMAEELLNALAKVKDLKVAGRTSSFHFKGKNEDLRTIGQALAVANVLEGSVRKQGNKVRITAQLIQASNGFHLWSETYDGDLSDVFELQERIAHSITDALKVVLQGEQQQRLVQVATDNPQAYALYLRATTIFNRRDGAHFPDAISALNEAIRLDPKFARAHSRLAAIYSVATNYMVIDFDTAIAAVQREADIAIALDPTLAEPHAALGSMNVYRRHWIAGHEELERALALDVNDVTANFWHGTTLITQGYVAKGIASIDRTLEIDPLLPNALAWRGTWYLHEGKLDKARRMLEQSVDAGLSFGENGLALIARDEGRTQDAIDDATRGSLGFLAGFPEGSNTILARGFFGDAADRAKAVAAVDAYVATDPTRIAGVAAWALLWLDEPARAIALVQNAPTTNDALFINWLWSPIGAKARRLPQFPEFVRKMGFVELWDKFGAPDLCKRTESGEYTCS